MALSACTSGQAQENSRDSSLERASAPTLKQALEAAWQRSLEKSESRGRQARALADQTLSQSWLAGAPAMSLGQREGLAGAPAGGRETEVGVALPLWRLGQRAADGNVAQAQSVWASAFEHAERLRLAGQVREAIGALHLAEVELRQVQGQAEAFGQLAGDVQRRVSAGDLAPADALAARSEWLAAQVHANLAAQALAKQQAQWRLLTGLPKPKYQASVAPPISQVPQSHPELLLATAAVELGQRRLDLARVQQTDSPELTLGLRQERPGQGSGSQSSLVMAIRLPVGGQAYQRPRIIAALGELDVAQTQTQRTRERLEVDLALAQSQLSQSLSQLQTQRERSTLLSERARLIDKSFRAGETALPEMLRALAAAAGAESAYARQQVNHQLAIARLEQALGLLP
jgi:cobalt-zinc-cadmium efflux system outer membrane protein